MSKLKILLIEDDEEMCEELRQALEREEYLVDIAYNAISGLRDVNMHRYNLVLLDLKLPGIGGLQVLKYIHDYAPDLKVIVITGNPLARIDADDFKRNNPELTYASVIMNKPFSMPEVLDRIKQLNA